LVFAKRQLLRLMVGHRLDGGGAGKNSTARAPDTASGFSIFFSKHDYAFSITFDFDDVVA
jgi:hypothetical protein